MISSDPFPLCNCFREGIGQVPHEFGAHKCIQVNMNEPKTAEMEEPVTEIPDVGSYIQAAAEELRLTLSSKNSDYAPTGEFSNFEKAAEFAGVEPIDVMMTQIGIKLTRIQNLYGSLTAPNNESLRDSLVDLAGYAVIAAAWLDSVQADAAMEWTNGTR